MRGQGFAVAIIVGCGVAIMIMALGALTSLQLSQDTYYERYRFAHIFAQVKRAPEALSKDIRNIQGVRVVETRITHYITLDIEGFPDPANGQLVSLPDEGEPLLNRLLMHKGRWPDPRRAEEIIASKAFIDAHGFRIGDDITGIINGRSRDLQIVGIADSPEYIYTLGPGALLPDDKRFGVFWMRRKALEAVFDLEGAFNDVSLSLSPSAKPQSVIDDLDRLLDNYGSIGAYARKDQLSNAFIEGEMQQLKSMARILPPIFLVVSAMLLNAILNRLIATERQQIGILKAFGYTKAEIGWHYIKLALAITIIGILMGYALGAVLARLVTNLYSDSFRFPVMLFRLSPSSFIISGCAAGLAAIAGAMVSAFNAAKLEAAEAMHPAPPENYQRGGVQQFFARLPFDEPTRMILRHLTRWPARAATTILGVAAAQGLLVGTLFSFDAIDNLTETFFYRTDPFEAAISFVEPRVGRAIIDFKRLPGVVSAEPVRQVAARMRFGPIEERSYISGLSQKAQNKRVLDSYDNYAVIPEFGITLSRQLANMIKARTGDIISLDILEGRRPTLNVPITSIVDEYIGSAAYMDKAHLNRLLMEGDVVTGAYAEIDPDSMNEFRQAVLDRPVISGVVLQSASKQSFEDTLDETITIMMTIYALIGGAIAAGVVYNAARIALTERGRELASMRVLGFTRSEVSYILIGELILLTLMALPLGCLLGAGIAYAVATGMSTKLFRVPIVIEPSTYGIATVIVLIAAVLSSILVIRRVARLDMIAVLKTKE